MGCRLRRELVSTVSQQRGGFSGLLLPSRAMREEAGAREGIHLQSEDLRVKWEGNMLKVFKQDSQGAGRG